MVLECEWHSESSTGAFQVFQFLFIYFFMIISEIYSLLQASWESECFIHATLNKVFKQWMVGIDKMVQALFT